MMKYAAFALLVSMIGLYEAKMQTITVKGTAICDKHRQVNVQVELWEKDTLDPNDLLAKTFTDNDGHFKLTGGDDEITSIAPYIVFKHHCKTTKTPGQNCTRTTEYTVPKSFIDGTYDMTYVTLDIFTSGEKEHCEKIKN